MVYCLPLPFSKKVNSGYLKDLHVGDSIRTKTAAIHFDVFKPLYVGLCITVYLAKELHITPHHCCGIGRQPSLQDRPMWRPLCQETNRKNVQLSSTAEEHHISQDGLLLESPIHQSLIVIRNRPKVQSKIS